ncbi:hypothetical protein HID58_063747 [Brassica napus]|uniref:Secreted protein n=1 Tax=Brassica napus TaxID=3708 RepID=A0ABQ7Z8A8_BRANA|nr:hypothetical protein HID58_063747 [Brassica napus]
MARVCVMFNFWLWVVHVISLALGSLRSAVVHRMIGNFQTDTLLCCVPPPRGRIEMKPQPELLSNSTPVSKLDSGKRFRFWETVALTAPVLPAFVSGKAVALIAPSFRRLLLRFDLESVLDLRFWSLCPIDSRSENLC